MPKHAKINGVAQTLPGSRARPRHRAEITDPLACLNGFVRDIEKRRPAAGVSTSITVDTMDPAQAIQPGDFLLTTIGSPTVNGLVTIGQAASGRWSKFSHAAVYVGGPDRLVIEMAPGGIKVRSLGDFAGRLLAISSWPLSGAERDSIVMSAWEDYRREPPIHYGWPNYPLIGAARLGLQPRWAREYLAGEAYQICSQWVDRLYWYAGVKLFDDGRLPGLVSPADLTYVLSQPKTA